MAVFPHSGRDVNVSSLSVPDERTTFSLVPRRRDRIDSESFRGRSIGDGWRDSETQHYTMYVYFSVNNYVLAAFIVCFLVLTFACVWWSYCKKRSGPSPVATSESDRRYRQEGLERGSFGSSSHDAAADDKSERACPGQSALAAEDKIDSQHGDKSLHTVLTEVGDCIEQTGKSVTLESKVPIHRNAMTDFIDVENNGDLRMAGSDWSDDTGATLKRQDADFDDNEETNSNKLEFDDDSYRAQCLHSDDDRQKETSPLMEDADALSEYLTNFSLPFTPAHLPADNREPDAMTPWGPGDSKDGEDLLQPDESFSLAQGVKAQPDCSPYHLAWFTPLPRNKWGLRSTSTRKLAQLQEELHLPSSAKRKLEGGAENVSVTSAAILTLNPSSKRQQTYDENAGIFQAADSRVTDRDSGLSSIIFGSQTDPDTGQGYSSAGSCPLPEVEVVRSEKSWIVETSHEEPPKAFFTRAHATKPCVCLSIDVSKPSGSCCKDPASQKVSVTPGQTAKSESVSLLLARGGCRSPRSAATAKTKSRSMRVTGTKVRPRLTFLHPKGKASLSEGCLADKPLCTSSVKNLVELLVKSSTADVKRCAGVGGRDRALSAVDDSLLWDSFPFRSASESLIWENEITANMKSEEEKEEIYFMKTNQL